MILKEFRNHFSAQLAELYPQTEIDSFFFLLIEEYLGFERIDVVLKSQVEISKGKIHLLQSATERLLKEEPIQYIIGKTEFYGLPFLVNKDVLIPRPETEELVEWVLLEIQKFKKSEIEKSTSNITSSAVEKSLSILDIGTGSGCIPISLKKNLSNAQGSAIDVSEKALKTATKNAALNQVDIHFIQQDILTVEDLTTVIANEMKQSHFKEEITSSSTSRNDNKFNIITSNPPYVRELEKEEIKNNVLENEPHLALFVDDNNALIFYNKIADVAKKHLTKNGVLFFEINQYLGKETVELLKSKGFQDIELRKDMFGNDRMIKATL